MLRAQVGAKVGVHRDPMGTDVLDLHGQIKFLGLHPALNKPVFENWFRGPAQERKAPRVALSVSAPRPPGLYHDSPHQEPADCGQEDP